MCEVGSCRGRFEMKTEVVQRTTCLPFQCPPPEDFSRVQYFTVLLENCN